MIHALTGNTFAIVGIFLALIPIFAWVLIFFKQYEYSKPKTYRVNVLLARTSLFLPLYAIFMWIALYDPYAFEGLQVPFAIVEGYSFMSVFAVIVANLGGPAATIRTMQKYPDKVACCPCYPREAIPFYTQVHNSIWYFVFLRVIVIVVATAASYNGLESLYLVATLFALAQLIYALISLVNFYESLFHLGLGHAFKIFTLKVSIGIIVIQSIIEMILVMTGTLDNVKAQSGYTQAGTIIRYYSFIVLLEYILFSMGVWYVYSFDVQYLEYTPADGNSSDPSAKETMGTFAKDVFDFPDLFYKYNLTVYESSDIQNPINAKNSISV